MPTHSDDPATEHILPDATGEFLPPSPPPPAFDGTGEYTAASASAEPRAAIPQTIDLAPESVDKFAATGDFSANAVPDGTCDYDANSPTAAPQISVRISGTAGASAAGDTGEFNLSAAEDAPVTGAVAAPTPRELTRYKLKKFHARGGMGEVWIAEDSDIGRTVALKRMRKITPAGMDSFLWEAQITGQLEHPGIVPVHELGANERGEPYYVMKFVHGRTLLDACDEFHATPRTDPLREVRRVRLLQSFLALCQTVAYAHSRGVIHRDIKPENVMTGEYGETLVLDWGLAKIVGSDERAEAGEGVRRSYSGESTETMAGSIKGTPWYMAPETAAGNVDQVDYKSDVYLLGSTLYHLITGQKPRQGKTLPELISAAHKPPIPPRTAEPSITRPLEAICLKAMAIDKADRYETAKALADDLQRHLAGEPVAAYRETFSERAWRWARRHRQAISRTAAALLVLAAAAFAGVKYREFKREQEAERVENERLLKEQADARAAAEASAAALQRQKDARRDREAFAELAEEARYLVASTNPVAAQAPYFNSKAGLAKGEAALALAAPWGERLHNFVLPDDRPALASDLYDLLLLMAQVRGEPATGPDSGPAALALLDRAAALRPTTRSYHRLRARSLATMGQAEPAAAETAKADDPATPLTATDHFLLGEQFRVPATRPETLVDREGGFRPNKDALTRAADEYRRALRLDPNNYWSNFQLGRCLLSLGREPEGVQTLGTCVALRPDVPWGYSARAVALIPLKRYDEAAADLERAIALDPNARLLRMNRGVLEWQRGKTAAALADFDAVLAPPTDQQLPEAAFYKAQLFGQLGKLDEAVAAADHALAGKYPVRPAYLLRAQLQLVLGRDREGLDDLNNFISGGSAAFDPASAAAAGQRGHRLRLIAQGLPPEQGKQSGRLLRLATAELEAAIAGGVATAEVYDDLGTVLDHLGRTADAVAAYTKSLEKSPKDVKVLAKRGWAYEKLQPSALAKARADFTAASRIDPDNAEAHTGLGYIQACLKAEPEARREAQRAVLYGGGDFLVLHNVACVYAKLSEVNPDRTEEFEDQALDYLARAVELWNRDRSGPNELAIIKGEAAFTKSLRARPEFKKLLETPGP